MSTAGPYLASVKRRLLVFFLDSGILLVASLIAFSIIDYFGQDGMLLFWIIPFLYFVYHIAILNNQAIAFGRVITAIMVVSIRGNELTLVQIFVRAALRTLLIVLGIVAAVFGGNPWLILMPCVVELMQISASPLRQSLADMLAGTLVVNVPQVQPHRAPAAPMYSATDSEFGVPPKWRNR